MTKLWLCDGKILANASGDPWLCPDDPCLGNCTCDDTPPGSIDVAFSGVALLGVPECADCGDYNATTYTLNRVGTSCIWFGAGECGHELLLEISSGTASLTVQTSAPVVLAVFIASISTPFDCESNETLALDTDSGLECDWSGATAEINP